MPTGDIPLEAKSDLAKWGVFDENMAWGGDICAPSVSKCEVKVGDYVMRVGDHGDFWTSKFSLKKQTKTSVILVGETKEFYLEVKFTLKNKELIRDYKVTNKIKFKLPFTFADHLLLPVTNVTLERNSGKMRVEWSYQNKLGQKGDMISWPVKRQKPFADKLFMKLKKDKKGNFSIFCLCHCEPEFIEGEAIPSDLRLPRRFAPRNDINNNYNLYFSSPELQYLGYWHTEGGWHNQTNMGLELTNTDRDSLAEAAEAGTVWWIAPQKSKKWHILLKVYPSYSDL